jgi:myo-inositol 2-dehydrogenase/D-chiro-inositol 1-dehydrogenase
MTALRIGVLGAGGHSTSNHGPAWRDVAVRDGQVERVIVCDLDEARARTYAERFGFARTCNSLDDLLAEGLDGIAAITPMDLTEELAGRILEAGIPVVIEKPPGVGVEGARRLRDVAVRTGTPHMISFNRRFTPALARARQWMAAGEHTPRHVISRMLRRNRLEPDFARDTGLHQVDAVLSVIGPPSRVEGRRERADSSRAANYTARIETATGITASIVQAPDVGVAEESMEILGDGFRVLLDFQKGGVRIDHDDGTVLRWTADEDGLAPHEACGAVGETEAFVDALRGNGAMAPTMEEGVVTMEAIVALQEGTTWQAPT